MNWIISSLLMFISSVALYLFVRKSTLLKNSALYNNLAMFLIPFIVFVSIGLTTKQNFLVSWKEFLILLIASFFFSYLGNVFSLVSIEYAPNPGYSLIISKSYVVFTTIVAVLLFSSELTLRRALAIILIILFSAVIMLSRAKLKKTVNKLWLPLSIGSFFCWGMLSLTSKYLFSLKMDVSVYLTYLTFIVSMLILLEMKAKKFSFGLVKKSPLIFLAIGIFSTTFNLFMMEAIKTAPNVGYVNAINASSISLLTIFAALLFKDELTLRKLVGVFGVTAGLVLLLL